MKRFTFLILSLSLLSIPSIQTNAAVKAGTSCTKVGQVKKSKGKSFVCAKQGKKLSWKQLAAPTPSPLPTSSPTPSSPTPSPSPTPTPTPTPSPTVSPSPTTSPTPEVKTLPFDPNKPIEFQPCVRTNVWPIGYLSDKKTLVVLRCGVNSLFYADLSFQVDQKTGLLIRDPNFSNVYSPDLIRVDRGISGSPSTPTTNDAKFKTIDKCKLKDGDGNLNNLAAGFPVASKYERLKPGVEIQVIPVDFSDLSAATDPSDDYKIELGHLQNYWNWTTTWDLNLKISTPKKYIRMPNPLASYDLSASYLKGTFGNGDQYWKFADAVIAAADSTIDFRGKGSVIIVFPPGFDGEKIATMLSYTKSPQEALRTAEGDILNLMITGSHDYRDSWLWAHEYGHLLGLRDHRNNSDPSNQKLDGMAFGITASGFAPELVAWDRFLIGALNDSQVICVPSNESGTFWLRPIAAKTDQPKMVVIPLDDFTGIVIESRRRHGYDMNLSYSDEGAHVYVIDTRIKQGTSAIKTLTVPRAKLANGLDTSLRQGESVTHRGWRISIVEAGTYGDVVKVEPIPTSFENLYAGRSGIAEQAWSKVSTAIAANKPNPSPYNLITGPNTKPYYDDWNFVISEQSRLFTKQTQPNRVLIIRYSFEDVDWAQNKARELMSTSDYEWISQNWNEGPTFAGNNCEANKRTCRGAFQKTLQSGLALIMQGVPAALNWVGDPSIESRYRTGVGEAHEYFHAYQTRAMLGKANGSSDWPPAWFREGSAEVISAAQITKDSLSRYLTIRSQIGIPKNDPSTSEEFIREYLNLKHYNNTGNWGTYDRMLAYNLGIYITEIFVALYGPDSLVDFYTAMSDGLGYERAFLQVFKRNWNEVIPIIAKTIAANIKDGL